MPEFRREQLDGLSRTLSSLIVKVILCTTDESRFCSKLLGEFEGWLEGLRPLEDETVETLRTSLKGLRAAGEEGISRAELTERFLALLAIADGFLEDLRMTQPCLGDPVGRGGLGRA